MALHAAVRRRRGRLRIGAGGVVVQGDDSRPCTTSPPRCSRTRSTGAGRRRWRARRRPSCFVKPAGQRTCRPACSMQAVAGAGAGRQPAAGAAAPGGAGRRARLPLRRVPRSAGACASSEHCDGGGRERRHLAVAPGAARLADGAIDGIAAPVGRRAARSARLRAAAHVLAERHRQRSLRRTGCPGGPRRCTRTHCPPSGPSTVGAAPLHLAGTGWARGLGRTQPASSPRDGRACTRSPPPCRPGRRSRRGRCSRRRSPLVQISGARGTHASAAASRRARRRRPAPCRCTRATPGLRTSRRRPDDVAASRRRRAPHPSVASASPPPSPCRRVASVGPAARVEARRRTVPGGLARGPASRGRTPRGQPATQADGDEQRAPRTRRPDGTMGLQHDSRGGGRCKRVTGGTRADERLALGPERERLVARGDLADEELDEVAEERVGRGRCAVLPVGRDIHRRICVDHLRRDRVHVDDDAEEVRLARRERARAARRARSRASVQRRRTPSRTAA